MTNSAVQQDVIRFVVPLPPVSLRANSRAFWATKKRDADAYSRAVYGWYALAFNEHGYASTLPWPAAKVTYTWKYAGVAPDHGNLGGNTKVLQDCLQVAPKNGGANRYYLGIVEDDKGITAEYRLENVKRRAAECVEVEIVRLTGREAE